MFGVVLWSDTKENKAVIWCEDHGDLAFYSDEYFDGESDLDAGDWVQFDLTMDRHMRLAHNPKLIAENVYPEIAETLGQIMPTPEPTQTETRTPKSARIIPLFNQHSTRAGSSHRVSAVSSA